MAKVKVKKVAVKTEDEVNQLYDNLELAALDLQKLVESMRAGLLAEIEEDS